MRSDAIPVDMPYLSADAKSVAVWAKRFADVKGKKIGVAWIGGQEAGILQGKPLLPETVASLSAIPGIVLISLQQTPAW